MTAVRFRVEGHVQGVSFRAGAHALATRLGLVGFVRNVDDGAVEGRVQGPDDAVATFLDGLWTASRRGRVDAVRHATVEPTPGAATFAVVPDAAHPTDDWP